MGGGVQRSETRKTGCAVKTITTRAVNRVVTAGFVSRAWLGRGGGYLHLLLSRLEKYENRIFRGNFQNLDISRRLKLFNFFLFFQVPLFSVTYFMTKQLVEECRPVDSSSKKIARRSTTRVQHDATHSSCACTLYNVPGIYDVAHY